MAPPTPPSPLGRTPILLDSSALLAFCLDEAGADVVADAIGDSADVRMTTANVAECTSRLLRLGWDPDQIDALFRDLEIGVVREDLALAILASELHARTRQAGLSLGDALCLAAALRDERPVLTADHAWSTLPPEFNVIVVR